MQIRKVLTIGGSDSSGGAGIQIDLATFTQHKVFGYSVITAVTAQNSVGINAIHNIPPEIVKEQVEAILEDGKVQAAKIGMMGTRKNIEATADVLEEHKIAELVIDPIYESSSGASLISPAAYSLLKMRLFPLARVVTPNIFEAEKLTGCSISDISGMKEAAETLHLFGAEWVLIKGGHLADKLAVDLLYDGKKFYEYPVPRVNIQNMRGTGCIFSAALAARLAQGLKIIEAVQLAKRFTLKSISGSLQLGKGARQALFF